MGLVSKAQRRLQRSRSGRHSVGITLLSAWADPFASTKTSGCGHSSVGSGKSKLRYGRSTSLPSQPPATVDRSNTTPNDTRPRSIFRCALPRHHDPRSRKGTSQRDSYLESVLVMSTDSACDCLPRSTLRFATN